MTVLLAISRSIFPMTTRHKAHLRSICFYVPRRHKSGDRNKCLRLISHRKYTRDGFNSRWKKAKQAAKEAFPDLDFNFTFHDLKAKGISDLEGTLAEKQVISGHKNITQTARYNRKIEVVPVVGGQHTEGY